MDDLISRQAAINALIGLPTWWADEGGHYGEVQPPMEAMLDPEDAVSAIENLATVQPEIIKCKDCKWKHGSECVRFADIRIYQDDFCSRAERRSQ